MKKICFIGLVVLIIVIVLLLIVFTNKNKFRDIVKYEGKTYVLLEYNMDIFTYHFNSNNYYEEDIIQPINHDKWDIVYFNGDLFVLDSQVKQVTKYYKEDKNYDWFIVFETENKEIKKSINITKKELKYLYNMESIKKNQTMKFEDIKQFANIEKVSKDGFIKALINLVHYEDSWYWKTEIMTDNDEEYIIEILDSLDKKIFELKDNN